MFKNIYAANLQRYLIQKSQKHFSVQYSKIVNKFIVSRSPNFSDRYSIFA